MRETFKLNDANISGFSRDWDDREQLQCVATQLDTLLYSIDVFGITITIESDPIGKNVFQSITDLESRMMVVENKIE